MKINKTLNVALALLALLGAPLRNAQAGEETKIGLSRNVLAQMGITHVVTNICQTPLATHVTFTGKYNMVGTLVTNAPCDELASVLPATALFVGIGSINLRAPDFRGLHNGTFKIMIGTNIWAIGSMGGTDGVGTHRACEPCDLCNHLEGLLKGKIVSGALSNCIVQASYSGTIESNCQSIPLGGLMLAIDGVVVCTNCIATAASD